MKKNIAILGSTGSIGKQTLEVVRELGIKVHALTGNKNISLLENQIREFKPKVVAVFDEKNAKSLKENIVDTNTRVLSGIEGLCEAACVEEADTVITAVSGMIGLQPTLTAINAKKNIALANKETLVTGGKLILDASQKNKVKILPVDSEHSAIFQCLESCNHKKNLKKLILTASGGPFFGKSNEFLKNVTLSDALNHPNWSMGAKITVDSATMMNKGLEIIEAVHLFDMPEDKIDVIVHRESIVHSMIEYIDGSMIAQMGIPTMKTPIRYALTYPDRAYTINTPDLNLTQIKNLSFYEPDNKTFEAMNICREAIHNGGSEPIIINAANEEAVSLFLKEKIKFCEIIPLINHAKKQIKKITVSSLSDILETDRKTREFIKKTTSEL